MDNLLCISGMGKFLDVKKRIFSTLFVVMGVIVGSLWAPAKPNKGKEGSAVSKEPSLKDLTLISKIRVEASRVDLLVEINPKFKVSPEFKELFEQKLRQDIVSRFQQTDRLLVNCYKLLQQAVPRPKLKTQALALEKGLKSLLSPICSKVVVAQYEQDTMNLIKMGKELFGNTELICPLEMQGQRAEICIILQSIINTQGEMILNLSISQLLALEPQRVDSLQACVFRYSLLPSSQGGVPPNIISKVQIDDEWTGHFLALLSSMQAMFSNPIVKKQIFNLLEDSKIEDAAALEFKSLFTRTIFTPHSQLYLECIKSIQARVFQGEDDLYTAEYANDLLLGVALHLTSYLEILNIVAVLNLRLQIEQGCHKTIEDFLTLYQLWLDYLKEGRPDSNITKLVLEAREQINRLIRPKDFKIFSIADLDQIEREKRLKVAEDLRREQAKKLVLEVAVTAEPEIRAHIELAEAQDRKHLLDYVERGEQYLANLKTGQMQKISNALAELLQYCEQEASEIMMIQEIERDNLRQAEIRAMVRESASAMRIQPRLEQVVELEYLQIPYIVTWESEALLDLQKVGFRGPIVDRINSELCQTPQRPCHKVLHKLDATCRRLRCGHYRVIFRVVDRSVIVLAVLKRNEDTYGVLLKNRILASQ